MSYTKKSPARFACSTCGIAHDGMRDAVECCPEILLSKQVVAFLPSRPEIGSVVWSAFVAFETGDVERRFNYWHRRALRALARGMSEAEHNPACYGV